MTCQNCARHVVDAIRTVPGIEEATVDLDQGIARVRWAQGKSAVPDEVSVAVQKAGFSARAVSADRASSPSPWGPTQGWRFNGVIGSLALGILMLGEWVLGLSAEAWFRWLSFFLALPVQFIGGARFYVGAWTKLRTGSSNMDTLVALGSTTAFGYSVWHLVNGSESHLFFMESVAIITLISIGHWLESLATGKAASAIRSLMSLAPVTALRIDAHGVETETAVHALLLGDRLSIKPGDRIPVDGRVSQGRSAVDESMLTGESQPIEKREASPLYAGTINLDGHLTMEITATGSQTALAQIIAAVQRCHNSRARIQRLGDRVSSVFVPLVILIAVASGLGWAWFPDQAAALVRPLEAWLWPIHGSTAPGSMAVMVLCGVLIVACPCAMGLATPAALMVGANVAARRGILIRDGVGLEKTGRITAVLFDKTGTLTQGRLEVLSSRNLGPSPQPALAALAASLASASKHPASQAIARLSDQRVVLEAWQEHRGLGVSARVAGGLEGYPREAIFRLGSLSWLADGGIRLDSVEPLLQEGPFRGATILGLAAGQDWVGLYALKDQPKPHAGDVVRQLQDQGKQVYLVTGDRREAAEEVARLVGLDPGRVFAEVLPENKAGIVERLQQSGERVAFVGDGINDAPALERADLGIAVARASDIARESADVVLLNTDVRAIPAALALAQATLRTIKQNLFWAFFYNAAAVPLAACGFLSPILCALAMGLSDLVVIGNSLRLQLWKWPVQSRSP
jgi:Cu+-exporting ATPase